MQKIIGLFLKLQAKNKMCRSEWNKFQILTYKTNGRLLYVKVNKMAKNLNKPGIDFYLTG